VPFTYDAADVILKQLTPVAADYIALDAVGTGEGDVTGSVIPVDINLTGNRANSSGCEAADFAGLDFSGSNDIALLQRGTCSFSIKAQNAQNAGAEAVVLFNQGDPSAGDRFGPLNPTLAPLTLDIPVVGTTFAAGEALAAPGATAQVKVDFYDAESFNVIGELAGKTNDNVVMAGAHLDSVPAGPGINDNGSGSAALLEVAQQMAKSKPQNTVRFAWWGAEELGLIGSTEWVGQRTPEELDQIALYLNFDMIGSPNYYFGVYDANESSFAAPVAVPDGSIDIEKTFESFYTLRGEPYDDSAFSGRSDYAAFIDNGIPPVACSPAPRSARRRSSSPSGAAPRARSSTRATTSPATRSTTTTLTRWRSTRMPWRTRSSRTPPPPRASTVCVGRRCPGTSASRRRLARSTRSPARWVALTTVTAMTTTASASDLT
jgi:hypothetical protein